MKELAIIIIGRVFHILPRSFVIEALKGHNLSQSWALIQCRVNWKVEAEERGQVRRVFPQGLSQSNQLNLLPYVWQMTYERTHKVSQVSLDGGSASSSSLFEADLLHSAYRRLLGALLLPVRLQNQIDFMSQNIFKISS